MCHMSRVICQVSGDRCQVSGVRCQMSQYYYYFFLHWSHMLHVKCNTSCFRCHMSVILCCMSPVTCHLSHDTCHMSPVTCHPSNVTCYISLILTPNSPTLHSRMVNEHSQTKLIPFLFKTAVPLQPILPFSGPLNISFIL